MHTKTQEYTVNRTAEVFTWFYRLIMYCIYIYNVRTTHISYKTYYLYKNIISVWGHGVGPPPNPVPHHSTALSKRWVLSLQPPEASGLLLREHVQEKARTSSARRRSSVRRTRFPTPMRRMPRGVRRKHREPNEGFNGVVSRFFCFCFYFFFQVVNQ